MLQRKHTITRNMMNQTWKLINKVINRKRTKEDISDKFKGNEGNDRPKRNRKCF